MPQPVRKSISEKHPELNIKPIYTLLVDGNNLLRRSLVSPKYNSRGEDFSGIMMFLLQLKIMLKKKIYDYIYVVFDEEDSGYLRYSIYKDYKLNRDKKYAEHTPRSDYERQFNETLKNMQRVIFDKKKPSKTQSEKADKSFVDENFNREKHILMSMFDDLFIRYINDDRTEGDDLIAYYVLNKKPEEKIIIWSTDEDYAQLISDDVAIYNQTDKDFLTPKNFKQKRGYPSENVLTKKILCGDSSDNIKNINGLSENRLFEMMPEMRDRKVTVDEVIERAKMLCEERKKSGKKPFVWQMNIVNGVPNGNYNGNFYEINRKLVDLRNPLLTDEAKEEMDMMRYNVQDPEDRTFDNIYKTIVENEITDLLSESAFSSFFSEFKQFANKEILAYKKYVKENP